jgi:hypothetical protein
MVKSKKHKGTTGLPGDAGSGGMCNQAFGKGKGYGLSDKKNKNLTEKARRALGCYASGDGGVVDRAGGKVTGTSIFDPVLCELVYRWFCPDGGAVLDPFAGGSVRGVVAGVLGYRYTGVDLRAEQVEANREQWGPITEKIGRHQSVKISSKWARHLFRCDADYIKSNCYGRCCEGKDGTLISLLPDEERRFREDGHAVEGGLLMASPETGKCPFKTEVGFCSLHGTERKPFGCVASPFTLNDNDTLILRRRYAMFKCHGSGEPAYVVFRNSLDIIFGIELAAEICGKLVGGSGDFVVSLPSNKYDSLKYLDGIKKSVRLDFGGDPVEPEWVTGDSVKLKTLVQRGRKYDLIFSCPPYGDLEVYSDDERDLSTMGYDGFLEQYRKIIKVSCGFLRENRFAVFVVGDFRDSKGAYRGFPSATIDAFRDAGLLLYNEAVLVTAIGSLPIRIRKQFQGGRKLGKTHQNVLVFFKGDPKKIADEFGVLDLTGLDLIKEE